MVTQLDPQQILAPFNHKEKDSDRKRRGFMQCCVNKKSSELGIVMIKMQCKFS